MADITIYIKGIDQSGAAFDSVRKNAGKSTTALREAYGSLKNLLAGYVGFQGAKSAIMTMGEIEQGWIGVAKTTGMAGEEMGRLKGEIRGLAREMKGVKYEELLSIAETAGQLGIQGAANISAFTETVAKMRVATDMTAEGAAEDLAQIANVLKIAIPDLEKVGSVMNELSNTTTATAGDISELTKRMGGAGQTLGLTAAEIMGISATLKDMGVGLEVGGTAMSQIFTKMMTDTKKFAEVAGLDLTTFSEMVRNKPVEAVRMLLQAMSEMDKFDAAQSLSELGLEGVRVGGVLLKLSSGVEVLDKNMKAANEEWKRGTSLQTEYAVASKSIFAEATNVSNAVKILAEDMSVTLLPAIKEVLGWIKDGVDLLSSFGKFLGEAAAKAALFFEGYNVSQLEASGGMGGPVRYDPSSVRRGGFTQPASQISQDPSAPFGTYSVQGNFAIGTSYISKDGLYYLHRGERVENPREVRQDNSRSVSNEYNFGDIVIQGGKNTEEDARALFNKIREMVATTG